MKKTYLLLFVMLAMLIGACTKVPAGNVGVKVYLLGTDKGVDSEELGPGRYWIGINEELYLFPTFTQNKVFTKDKKEDSPIDQSFTFQTSEGLSVNADIGVSYHFEEAKINSIFQKYRRGTAEVTGVYMRNHIRSAFNNIASKYPVESVYGNGKSKLIAEVQDYVMETLSPQGIIVEDIYWANSIRLPETVRKALDMKVEAKQRAEQRENELREEQAQARKMVAKAEGEAESILKRATAQAKANQLISRSLTKSLVEYERIKKWNGKMPHVTGGAVPMFNLNN